MPSHSISEHLFSKLSCGHAPDTPNISMLWMLIVLCIKTHTITHCIKRTYVWYSDSLWWPDHTNAGSYTPEYTQSLSNMTFYKCKLICNCICTQLFKSICNYTYHPNILITESSSCYHHYISFYIMTFLHYIVIIIIKVEMKIKSMIPPMIALALFPLSSPSLGLSVFTHTHTHICI